MTMFKGQNSSVACPRVSYGIWPLCLFSIAMYRAHFTLEASRPRSSVLENKAFGLFCLLLSKKRIWPVLKWLRISWVSVYVLRSLTDLVHHPGTCNAKLDVLAVSLSKMPEDSLCRKVYMFATYHYVRARVSESRRRLEALSPRLY